MRMNVEVRFAVGSDTATAKSATSHLQNLKEDVKQLEDVHKRLTELFKEFPDVKIDIRPARAAKGSNAKPKGGRSSAGANARA